jgi:molybdopterin molybdotransferase
LDPFVMFSTSQAWQTIRAHAAQLDAIRVPLSAALGRTLRTDARADIDSPPFDASAMDGYAINNPTPGQSLRLIGESQAGQPFAGAIGSGECIRIFTGATVPASTTRVIKQEDVIREGDFIRVSHIDGPSFIRRRGENRRAGDVLVPAGTPLSPSDLAALASAGVTQPEVTRVPRCVHLVTGNELVPPGQKPGAAQIRDSNSTLIAALLQRHGAELAGHAHARDDLAAAQAIVAGLPAHDVLLISGGASVGDHDFSRPVLQALGYTLHFQAINLRPGKPLVFASRGSQLAFALPGNPVSHWVVFHLFVAPLLQHLQTGAGTEPARLNGRLAPGSLLPPPDTRQTFWPGQASIVNGAYELKPLPLASSGDSSGLAGANALLSLPSTARNLDSHKPVEFILCP